MVHTGNPSCCPTTNWSVKLIYSCIIITLQNINLIILIATLQIVCISNIFFFFTLRLIFWVQILNDVSKYHNYISKRYRYINWNSHPNRMKPFLWKRNSTRNLIYIFFFCWYIPMLNGIQSTNSHRELNPSLTYITNKPLYHIWSLTRRVQRKRFTTDHKLLAPSSLFYLPIVVNLKMKARSR